MLEPSARPRRTCEVLALAAALAVVAWCFGQLVVGRLLTGGDILDYSLPNRVQAARALRHLRFPAWDPFRFAGAPFLANPQAAVLYPLHWPLALFVGTIDRAQDVSLVLHLAIFAAGAYAFARVALRASPLGSAVAAAAVGAGGFAHGHAGQFEQVTSMAWLPWALLAADRVVSGRDAHDWRAARRPAVGLAAALALGALAGHTQYLYMAIVAVVAYAALVARPLHKAVLAVAATALGLALAAAQLLPSFLVSRSSLRSSLSVAASAQYSLPRGALVSAFLPEHTAAARLPSTEYLAWLPWSVLVLAGLALATRRGGRRSLALAVLAAGGTVLALGTGTPLFRVAHALAPGFDRFRVPARWLLLPAVALPLLAAPGLDALAGGVRARRGPAAAVLAVALAAVVGLAVGDHRPGAWSLALGALAAALTILGWRRSRAGGGHGRAGRAVAGAVAIVAALELVGANAHAFVRTLRMPPGFALGRPATLAALDDPTGGRVLSLGTEDVVGNDIGAIRRNLRPNGQVIEEVRSPDGYDGGLLLDRRWSAAMARLTGKRDFEPLRMVKGNIVGPLAPATFAELDVTRVVTHEWSPAYAAGILPPGTRHLARVGDVDVWATPTRGPVFLAGDDIGAPSLRAPPGLRLLRDVEDPERLTVVVPPAAGGRRVVVSEAYARGWSASRGTGVRPFDGWLLSFDAPASGGRVVLRYRAPGGRVGAVVSVVALGLAVGALALSPRARRSSPRRAGRRPLARGAPDRASPT